MLDARYLSFSSAGTRGVAYCGVLDAIEDHLADAYQEWRSGVRGVAGCSSGSIAALLFALGISAKKRTQLIREATTTGVVLRQPDLAMFLTHFGLEDSTALKSLVERILETGGLSSTSTLGDLRRLLRMSFAAVATHLDDSRPVLFTSEDTPHVRVADAVCASCCVPFVYRPYVVDGVKYVDGCLTCAQPNPFVADETLFVSIDGHDATLPTSTWFDYVFAIVRCASNSQAKADATHAVVVHMDGVGCLDARMTIEKSRDAVRVGYVHARDQLRKGALIDCVVDAARVLARHATTHERLAPTEDEVPP